MPIIFESIVKSDKKNGWFIQLRDTQDNRVLICEDLAEYETKMQKFEEKYKDDIEK